MTFIFYQPTEFHLRLVCEFYANLDPRDPLHEVKVRDKVVRFTIEDINNLLGILEADGNQLRQMIITVNYLLIKYFLCGTRLAARRSRQ